MSNTLTAEQFLNNDLKGTHQIYDETGVTLITGIEHSEICRIMDEYANYLHKAKVESIKTNINFDEWEQFCSDEIDNLKDGEQIKFIDMAFKYFKQKLLEK